MNRCEVRGESRAVFEMSLDGLLVGHTSELQVTKTRFTWEGILL